MGFSTALKVPPEPAFASLVESFVDDAAARAALDDARRQAAVAAARAGFEEIVENATTESRDAIRLIATCEADRLAVSLFERGLPMDDAFARRNPKWNEIGERVDEVHWHFHGKRGSELRLRVHRQRSSEIAGGGDAAPPSNGDVPLAPPQEYDIRKALPADAPGIARAFYRTYGYNYMKAAVYEPERLIEMNASGRYTSIVAVGADGTVAAHCALFREAGAPIGELCGAVVLPEHRGRHLMDRVADRTAQEALEIGLDAYWVEPVTDHPRSQMILERWGVAPCGVTLGEFPVSFVPLHMELSTTTQRQTGLYCVKVMRERAPRATYAPPRHRAMIAEIYARLGVEADLREGGAPAGPSAFHTCVVSAKKSALVTVESIGERTGELVAQAVEDLRAFRRLGAIFAVLPLDDPATPGLCDAMEKLGFFFSGIGPCALDGRDALRLQMPLTPLDFSTITVVGDFAGKLFAYVESCSRNAPA